MGEGEGRGERERERERERGGGEGEGEEREGGGGRRIEEWWYLSSWCAGFVLAAVDANCYHVIGSLVQKGRCAFWFISAMDGN